MLISSVVLAGGSSMRMGSPKPLLPFGGRSCLSMVAVACRGSRSGEMVLVLGADADAIVAALSPEDAASMKVLINEDHRRGQTSSLKTGLEGASPRSDGYLILPVDHPLVTSSNLDALIDRFEARPRGRTIFIASHEGRRGHPALFAAIHRAAILELSDDEPLRDYIRLHEGEVAEVAVDNPGVVLSMNTPDEYREALALWRARGGARSAT